MEIDATGVLVKVELSVKDNAGGLRVFTGFSGNYEDALCEAIEKIAIMYDGETVRIPAYILRGVARGKV
jgi:hypothetical protein